MSPARLLTSVFVVALSVTTLLAQASGKVAGSEPGGTIVGKVTVQGKPLPLATITLWQQPLAEPIGNNVQAIVQCNERGEYAITKIPPGNYFIAASSKGFITGKENQIFGNLRYVNSITSASNERIDLELVPESVIKGVVTDADGKPVPRIPIEIFAQVEPRGTGPPPYAKELRTDEFGAYRIAGVPAGKYRIAAGYYPVTNATVFGRVGYRRVFYGGADTEAGARVIEVAAGTELSDINIKLGAPVKTFSVSARVIDEETGKGVENLSFVLQAFLNGERIGGAGTRTRTNENGELVINGVPPGEYSIRVPGGSGVIPQGELPPAPNIFGESKHFNVSDGNLSGIEVRLTRGVTATGFVVIEGAATVDLLAKVPQMRIVTMAINMPVMPVSIKPDNSFTVTGLRPGKVRFEFMAPLGSAALPLRFVRIERDGVVLGKEIEVAAGEQVKGLRLVLAYANSTLHGVVKLESGGLPDRVSGVASLLQNGKVIEGIRGELSAQGEFLLQNLPAGDFTLGVSVRDANNGNWRSEQPVHISDDSAAQVTVILKTSTARRVP